MISFLRGFKASLTLFKPLLVLFFLILYLHLAVKTKGSDSQTSVAPLNSPSPPWTPLGEQNPAAQRPPGRIYPNGAGFWGRKGAFCAGRGRGGQGEAGGLGRGAARRQAAAGREGRARARLLRVPRGSLQQPVRAPPSCPSPPPSPALFWAKNRLFSLSSKSPPPPEEEPREGEDDESAVILDTCT